MNGEGGKQTTAVAKQATAAARDQLIAELHHTVDTVTAAVDEAAARLEALAAVNAARLRALSTDLVARAIELDGEIAALIEEATVASATLRDHGDHGDHGGPPAEPPPVPAALVLGREEVTLDDVDAIRAAVEDAPVDPGTKRRLFRRRGTDAAEVPEGVRLMIVQMRLAGESDSAIKRYLDEMGVKDPAGVIAQLGI